MSRWNHRAEDAIAPESLPAYSAGMHFIYGELVQLNTILYLAEKIVEFPWTLLGRKEEIFFNVVMRSFHDSAVLMVTRLLSDQGADPFTLLRFKNRVREWVIPALRARFDDYLKGTRFDRRIERIVGKANDLRDGRIAHTDSAFVSGQLTLFRPSLSELKKVCYALQRLFDALAFDVEYKMLPLDYDPQVIHGGSRSHTTDIDDLLDSVAKSSFWLNMPETHPERWHHARSRLSPEQFAILNQYRRRFGMEEV